MRTLLLAGLIAGSDGGFQHSDHPPPAFITIENDHSVPCRPLVLTAIYGHGVPVKVTLCEALDAGATRQNEL